MNMKICEEVTNANPNSIYIAINVCLEGYNKYELCGYIDSGCSICFEKRSLFPEFMCKRVKNPLQVRIADNSIMSRNEAIEGLSIELGGVQCIIPILWATNQPSYDTVSYTHLRAHETDSYLVCRLLLEKKSLFLEFM